MDHLSYLSQTLWEYCGSHDLTDVTLVCQDGTLPAHAAMLATLFRSFGIRFTSREEIPSCIILPDCVTKEVQHDLKKLYLQNREKIPRKYPKRVKVAPKKEGKNRFKSEKEIECMVNDKLLKYSAQANLDKVRVEAFSEEFHEQIRRCKTCGENFQNKRERLKHRQIKHSNELEVLGIPTGKKDQSCPYCNKMYEKQVGRSGRGRFRQTLEKHIFKAHKSKLHLHSDITPEVQCDECDNEFYNLIEFNRHRKLAHGEKAICQVCSKVTKSKIAMDIHMKVHANEVHICKVCRLEYKCLAYLKNHYSRMHETKGETPFSCKLCYYKRAQTEEKLNKHMLENHSGVKYICTQCTQCFKKKIIRE